MRLTDANTQEQLNKVRYLYEEAFPKSEKKPFGMILKGRKKGTYEIMAIENEEGGFQGLAIIMRYGDLVLLDYFAIHPMYRGTGVGSKALKALQKRYEGNMTQDLTEFIEKDGYDMMENFGDFVETTYIDGKVYALPTTLTQNAILVNKDMFDEAGIEIPTSWTLEEMREIAKKLTKGEGQDKVYGMFWNTGAIMGDLTPTKLSLGGDFMYKEGGKETNFDNPLFKENISIIYDMMNVDGSSPTHVDSVTQKLTIEGMFLSEKTAMTVGSWTIRNIKNTTEYPHDFVTAAVPYPTMNEDAEYWNGELGDLLSMNSKSKHKEAAWEFMKWYAQEGMLPVVSGGRVPANRKFNLDDVGKAFLEGSEELFDADSIIYSMIEPKDKYWVQTILNKAPEISKILNEELESVYIGEKSIDDALASAKERGDEKLK